MKVIKKTTKFTKEIKKPDEFITAVIVIGRFIKEHKEKFLFFLALVLISSAIYLGLDFYKDYSKNSDSLTLSRRIKEYQEFKNGRSNSDITQIISDLGRIMERQRGSIIEIRAGVLLARIYEDNNEFTKAGNTLKEISDRWAASGDIKSLLLLNSARNFARAGEYDKAIDIYNNMIRSSEAQKNEIFYLRKAETLKMAGRYSDLNEFVKNTEPEIQDQVIKLRLTQLLLNGQKLKIKN